MHLDANLWVPQLCDSVCQLDCPGFTWSEQHLYQRWYTKEFEVSYIKVIVHFLLELVPAHTPHIGHLLSDRGVLVGAQGM